MFKSSLNDIKSERQKSKEQKNTLPNTEILWEAQKKLVNYLIIILKLHLSLNIK